MPPKVRSSTGGGGAKARRSSSSNAFAAKGKPKRAATASSICSAAVGSGNINKKDGGAARPSLGVAALSEGGTSRTSSNSTKRSPSAADLRASVGNCDSVREYSKEELDIIKDRPDLDVKDPAWDAYWDATQEKMGLPKIQPIHTEGQNRIHHMLRTFDLDPAYGPAIGMTRLQRWHRAKALGDDPPEEVRAILETKQGMLELGDHVFVGTGI
ncbi:hypothetical protein K437DRAFT_254216 [Tilletiaria anomala UBC 951]|uniref:DNA polymerase delta subunit 4 n=1 Tax=Tilletiaria anomala (strain ATCC 24038 / CBS 436.72 / UBC 951) TaxID=1037660 RepID=A0A066WP96_TILAU|nr:uncharacterized protein K437DRAFT_254216 [Tilletiaria anomala UBC 951]KDN52440.1 hypothetical protein K437DRAFT_254216 [Tilletiaria anomala UBC 951]